MSNIRTAGLTKLTENLQVVDCEQERIIFAFGTNIGYISPDKIFYVKKDYFEGGTKSTVHMKQAIKIVEQTYQLQGSITEERVWALENSVKELNDITAALGREKDPVKVKALVENAATIVKEFGNDPNKQRFAAIEAKANSILNPPAAPVVEKAPIVMGPGPDAAKTAEAALAAAKKNAPKRLSELNKLIKKEKKGSEVAAAFLLEAEALVKKFPLAPNQKKLKTIKATFKALKKK